MSSDLHLCEVTVTPLTPHLWFQIQDDGATLEYNPYSWNKVCSLVLSGLMAAVDHYITQVVYRK